MVVIWHTISEDLVILFADHITVVVCAENCKELDGKITYKAAVWGFILNMSKWNLMFLSGRNSITFFPGFTIESNLNWKAHLRWSYTCPRRILEFIVWNHNETWHIYPRLNGRIGRRIRKVSKSHKNSDDDMRFVRISCHFHRVATWQFFP